MEKTIHIIRQPYEEPYHINLIFRASNGQSTGELEIYDNAEQLKELADALEGFPFNGTKTFLWELGSEKPKDNFAFYFKCEFSLLKHSSDCIVRIRLNNNKNSLSEFNIQCYTTELNKLGQLFREFSKLKKKTLTWYGFDGEVK
ncbi:hypothetical protein SAMN04487910_1664 [Aquimarina amphilecti]|uniref:Uncharacterized protein n=1 Tax=Aquimarina amphilecti TaxID=1038014 RepID=A0A1H7MAS7_AQUAM|nr:hypothetical protein [Aquimarina amphilecti]SEL08440.1 hypothetical protein SAMN04487910_1664 [Aquimarina amphilecti]